MRFEDIRKRVQGCTARVVLAAADDHTALEALHQAVLEGIAEPLLIGDTAAVTPILASIGIPDWAP
ncbi:phosphate butyryltransferase, partial [bacterium]|nr:phosphate butyryltransferase [candidate division CSSED10-310 bacterium]